jgi:SAM-dependent methyltransferase
MKNTMKNYVKNKIRDQIRLYNQETHINNQADYPDSYYLAATLDQLSNINLWWVDEAKFSKDFIEISGWAIVPCNMQNNVAFTVNNVLFDAIKYPIFNSGLAKKYYFKPNSAMCGFNCLKYTKETKFEIKDNQIICNIVDKKTLIPLDGYYNVHSEVEKLDNLPMPDDFHLARIGTSNLQNYKSVGFDKFMRLQEVLIKYANKTFTDMERILDWGCGCGQVLRYFNKYHDVEVNGADIDIVSIKWCESNLDFAKFHHVPLSPPTSFPNGYFDLIFGISVLTHLRENDQSDWLAELSRISRKGGIVLLSVHGNGGVAFRNELFDINKLFSWQEKGFLAIGVDRAIDSINDKEYYTTSFQTDWYIKKQWAKYFQIIDVIPSYIGHFQDLVVMQKI